MIAPRHWADRRRHDLGRRRLNWPLVVTLVGSALLWLCLILVLTGCTSLQESAARSCAKYYSPGTARFAECQRFTVAKSQEHLQRSGGPALSVPPPVQTLGPELPGEYNQIYTIHGRRYNCSSYAGHTTCH